MVYFMCVCFVFPYSVFKKASFPDSYKSALCGNEFQDRNMFSLFQRQILDSSKLKQFADDNFNLVKKEIKKTSSHTFKSSVYLRILGLLFYPIFAYFSSFFPIFSKQDHFSKSLKHLKKTTCLKDI